VRELATSGIHFIEQPVRADDLDGLREVRALGTPVIADESVYSPDDVLRVGQAGAADIVSIYVGKSSALERAVDGARLAGRLGMDVVIGANGEMGIGAAAQLHVACACERISAIPHGIIGHHFYDEDASLETPLVIDGVVAKLPDGPGLGVEPSAAVRQAFSS
jgi:L-alanine-DL-glutamate epimerase-like enolase superfamily enzyme